MEQESDPSAEARFDAIIESYGAFLRRAILRVCPKDLGLQFDDIEQEARLKLWNALKGERNIENTSSYLFRIAATTTVDAIRKVRQRRESQLDELETGDDDLESRFPQAGARSPEDLAAQREMMGKVQTALAMLSDNRRRSVSLHLRGLNNIEVAEILGWSESKARNLIYRGLNDLRKRLRGMGIDYDG